MKTIAVLTDFTGRSEHAARYAIHLAQKIKADILLFNAFLTPSDIPMVAAEVAWPLDYEENRFETDKALHELGKQLEHWAGVHEQHGNYQPKITCECQQGPLSTAIDFIEKNKDVFLIVMGAHGADALTTMVLGDSCRQLIDGTKLPLLMVPEHARFKTPEVFAFATELQFVDIVYLTALGRLAACFAARVIVMHVEKNGADDKEDLELFMNRVANKVDYNKIAYCAIPGKTAKKGLEQLMAQHKPDVLVMMHHEKGFWASMIEGSQTQKMAAHTPVPLLIFSYVAQHMFRF